MLPDRLEDSERPAESLPHEAAPAPDVALYPAAPLPVERPQGSRQVLEKQPVLGTPRLVLDDIARAGIEYLTNNYGIREYEGGQPSGFAGYDGPFIIRAQRTYPEDAA